MMYEQGYHSLRKLTPWSENSKCMDVYKCNVMIDWAFLDLLEVVPIFTLCWKCLNLSNQVNLQNNVCEFEAGDNDVTEVILMFG